MASTTGGLAGRIRSGMAWSVVESWSVQILQFLTFMIIARYVDAAALGIVAMALLVGQFFQNTVLSSLSAPLVSAGRHDPELDDTAFWIAAALGAGFALSTLALALPAQKWMGQPGLASVLAWLSLANFLAAFNLVPQATLTRSLMMRPLAVRSTLSTVAGGLVGIVMAMRGHGLTALVAQNLVTAATGSLILWMASPARPRLRFDRQKARAILFYGRHGTTTGIANFFNANADVLAVSMALGAAATGVYTVGKRALLAANLLLARAISRVALPAFSQIKHEPQRLADAFLKMVSATSLITTPAFVGLALIADEFIQIFFGERWMGAADVMRPLCLFGALQAIGIYNQSLMLAMGKPHWQTRLAILSALANLSLFFMTANQGIAAVANAFTLRAYMLYPFSVWPVILLLPLGWKEYGKAIQVSFFTSAAMAASVLIAERQLTGAAPPLRLACMIATGFLAYALALLVVGRSQVAAIILFARGQQPLPR